MSYKINTYTINLKKKLNLRNPSWNSSRPWNSSTSRNSMLEEMDLHFKEKPTSFEGRIMLSVGVVVKSIQ